MRRTKPQAEFQKFGPKFGRWGKPIPAAEFFARTDLSRQAVCEDPEHDGRRARLTLRRMFVQPWALSRKEYVQALREFDVISLSWPPRILCAACALRITKNLDRKNPDRGGKRR